MQLENIKNELNEDQIKAVYCEKNAVVAAGAGSGKTKVLANRFIWLITEKGFKVDEILTLTFTKKAAAEMFRRIYSLVLETSQNETGTKAKRAKEALDNFLHARIQTLDSYSSSIVKQCAPRYGISPDFKIDQDRCYSLALEISYPFFIANRRHPAVEKLYSINGPNSIVSNIFADIIFEYCHIDKPLNFIDDTKKQFNIICKEWEKYTKKLNDIFISLENDIKNDESLLPALLPIIVKNKRIEMPQPQELQKYFDFLLSVPNDSYIEKSEEHPLQISIISFLFYYNNITSVNMRGGKRSDNPVKENLRLLREISDSVFSLAISCLQGGFILSIMSLLTQLQDIYLTRKRTEGILSYTDIAKLSRTILIEQIDIRQSEKDAFKAIMIDEFQDNNELQKDILFLLSEKSEIKNEGVPLAKDLYPNKLFFVGDEKQSIYLFRGADVSVFRKLKDELGSENLPLKMNYRSSPHLIGAFNTIFGGIDFLRQENTQGAAKSDLKPAVFAPPNSLPPYEAQYSPLEAFKKDDGNLSLCILNTCSIEDDEENEENYLHPDENEARFVAEKIKTLLTKYAPHEIAILFRTGTPQYHFEKHLRHLGIPYTCENISNLFFGGLVNDIISALRLVAHHSDSASYAEMLRSPFAGLSISGTSLCFSLFTDAPFNDAPISHLDDEDKEKYLNGQKLFYKMCELSEKQNISSLVSELWYNEGYRYETEWNPDTIVYREMFDYLFHHAAIADSENQTLASFTDEIIKARENNSRLSEIDIPLESPSAVKLTTIHKSKGLEYPVVFLCCCGRKSQIDKCDIVYHSDTAGIVFSPPPPSKLREISGKRSNFFWKQASEEAKQKRTAELRRLLYVGMTRAEKELYITGSLDIKNADEDNKTQDFSCLLKNYINAKCEKSENFIESDSIINNDTLFGLLLPAMTSHIPQDGLSNSKTFFNLEEIERLTEESIKKADSKNIKIKNDQNGLNEFFKKTQDFYEKAQIIITPVIRNNHIAPTQLKETKPAEAGVKVINFNSEYSGKKADDVFIKVDKMLSRFIKNEDENSNKFNSGSFGTIAHICVEALLNKEEPLIPGNISCLLSPAEFSAFLEAGKEIALRFVGSPLGKIAENASIRENEFPFRSIIKNNHGKEIFINGTIDLFFEEKDAFHIVDFKTDSKENPWEHTAQMSCYYNAVASLFAVPSKKECRVWLYYLRTGRAVEMTEKTKQFNLEQKVFL